MAFRSTTSGILLNGADMSADILSSDREVGWVMQLSRAFYYLSLQIETKTLTTHVGTLYWQVSNTGETNSWNDLGSLSITSGTAISSFQDSIGTAAKYLRIFYDFTSGGGDLHVTGHSKQQG